MDRTDWLVLRFAAGRVVGFGMFVYGVWKAWHDGDYAAGAFYVAYSLACEQDAKSIERRLDEESAHG